MLLIIIMKKAFLIPALAAGMLLTSCDGNTPNPGNGGGKYDDYPYSALTPEQQKAAGDILKTQAGRKRGAYNKKYPQAKQDLYNGLVEYLTAQGAEIIPLERQNFRDLEFTLAGTKYKIVLSNPRT